MIRKTVFFLLIVAIRLSSFAAEIFQTIPLADFPDIYATVQRDNLAQIVETSGAGSVSNVFPIYIAGHIHSELAIQALLDRIEWTGLNEPEKHYYHSSDSSVPRLGIVTCFPKPPTPAVAALTQMPVSWQVLQEKLESAPAASHRAELLAWVAAVRHPTVFFAWMDQSYTSDTNRWASLSTYAATNLVGRKPFLVSNYDGYSDFAHNEALQLYDNCIQELRNRAIAAQELHDTQTFFSISNVLHTLRQPIVAPTLQELAQTVELVPQEVDVEDIPDVEEVILTE